MTEFRLLGGFEIFNGERLFTIKAPRQRQVLALMVMYANQVVHTDLLIEELWSENPPRTAVSAVQTYVYQLRKIFECEGLREPGSDLLVSKTRGYVLPLEPEQVDVNVFQMLARRGCDYLEKGRPEEAGTVFRKALDMWRGPALADVMLGRMLSERVIPLEEERLHVLQLRIQADLQRGLHRALIGELKSLVAAHPLNEWFSEKLISALSHAGRRSEALQAYQSMRQTLNEELGLEPGPELQRLHHEVLAAGYAPVEESPAVVGLSLARA